MWDAVVIGGGVIGCAVARELSRYAGKVCLVERNEDVCTGTSKANSAIVHAGFDAMPGTKKSRFNVEGSRMMEELSRELDFSYRRCGALVLCFEESGLPQLRELLHRGEENGVEGLEILSGERLRAMEPAVSEDVVAALWAPTSAIVCPFGLTIALAENAAANGIEFRFDTRVDAIRREGDHFVLSTTGGEMETRTVISAAGVYGDVLHNQLCPDDPRTDRPAQGRILPARPARRRAGGADDLPAAGKLGKGVLVSPTVHGNLLIGPTATDQEDRDGTDTTQAGLDYAVSTAERSVPHLPMRDVITSFAGLRAHLTGGDDFVIGESCGGFFEALGIESPGLSSAPAIGAYLARAAAEKLGLAEKADFNPRRRGIPHLKELPFAERQALAAQNPPTATSSAAARESPRAKLWRPSTACRARGRSTASSGACAPGWDAVRAASAGRA